MEGRMFGKRTNPTAPSNGDAAPTATATPAARRAAAAAAAAAAEEAAPEQLWAPPAAKARKSVEQLLLERGQVNEEQLLQAKQVQSQTPGKSIQQILLTMSAASEEQVLAAVAETLGLSFEERSEEHTSELQSRLHLVCRLLLEKK